MGLSTRIQKRKWSFLIVLVFSFLSIGLYAQGEKEGPVKNRSWFTIGAGASLSLNDNSGYISVVGDVSFEKRSLLQSVKILTQGNTDDGNWEIAYLFGKASQGKSLLFSISGGPSFVKFVGSNSFRKSDTIGASLSSQLFVRSSHFGIGLYILGNVNKTESYISGNIALQFGRMHL